MELTKLRLTILLILYARPNYSIILFLVFNFDIYSKLFFLLFTNY